MGLYVLRIQKFVPSMQLSRLTVIWTLMNKCVMSYICTIRWVFVPVISPSSASTKRFFFFLNNNTNFYLYLPAISISQIGVKHLVLGSMYWPWSSRIQIPITILFKLIEKKAPILHLYLLATGFSNFNFVPASENMADRDRRNYPYLW